MNRYNHTQRIIEHLITKNINSLQPKGNNHLMVALTGTNIGLDEAMRELTVIRKQGFTMDIVVSNSGEEILDIKEICRQLSPKEVYTENLSLMKEGFMEEIDGVIVPLATQNTAFKLVLGIQDQLIPRLLWQALWQGKPVWMNLEDLTQYKGFPTKQPFMLEKVKENIKQLEKMGIKHLKRPFNIQELLLEIENCTNYNINLVSTTNTLTNKETFTAEYSRQVITEKDILTANTSLGEMIVPKGAIVTPLAKDTAKALGIQINKK
ncbi:flavoprotein [Alkaliphilus peptidifermentans]|uniref:Flavoprotein n=1 Tax=Alkaliphilus peptidifermentans DSM 18978 TaxID=1120976 RepID=A0A1G5KVS2_9FIRM|nr:flavoprotein [Alkaliphilus peptidifermentans]SCZ04705.1 flavoprotein [Alkaliphilus peptidifermentans DSM 18978]